MRTRQALIEAATEQFALKGFEGTTVADIQTAVGLTAGSGALYKHFKSKEALFAECVQERLGDVVTSYAPTGQIEFPQELEPALRMLVTEGLAHMGRGRPLTRLMFQDGHRFPDLRDQFRGGIRATHRAFAAWLTVQIDAGRVRPVDVRATAAVLLGPIISYRVTEEMIGEPPAQISQARFIDGWVDLALAALSSGPDR